MVSMVAMAFFGHDLLYPRPLTWPIWADFGRARPILVNGPPLPSDRPLSPRTALRRTALRGPPSAGPPSAGPPKISCFFFLSRHNFHSFFLSLGSSRGMFWSVGTSNVLVFALKLSCGSPQRPAGRMFSLEPTSTFPTG